MIATIPEPVVINRLIRWAERREDIRAMLLYSSRTNPTAQVDIFSDYDILLAVTDIHKFYNDDRWLEDFGKVLVVFRNPIGIEQGFECFGFVTHYQDGTKIDYGFYPVEFFHWVARQPELPEDFDYGYRVLLDKDRLTEKIHPPAYRAYLPKPPTEKEYRAIVEEFFNDALYVGKHLWRGNLFAVKLSLDYIMKYTDVRKMLEWRMEIDQNWSLRTKGAGREIKQHTDPGLWTELGETYVGAGMEENWEALFKTIQLFRKVANEVAGSLGFTYPADLDRQVIVALEGVRGLKNDYDSL